MCRLGAEFESEPLTARVRTELNRSTARLAPKQRVHAASARSMRGRTNVVFGAKRSHWWTFVWLELRNLCRSKLIIIELDLPFELFKCSIAKVSKGSRSYRLSGKFLAPNAGLIAPTSNRSKVASSNKLFKRYGLIWALECSKMFKNLRHVNN